MILINLLPVRQLQKRAKTRSEMLVAVAVFSVVMCCILGSVLYVNFQVQAMRDEVTRLQAKKDSYNATLKEIKDIEAQKKKLFAKIEAIKELKTKSQITVRILDEIAKATPANSVWLDSLKQGSSTLTLTGTALDNTTIADYMNSLERSKFIQDTNLGTSTNIVVAERNLKKFNLTMGVSAPKEEIAGGK